MEHDITNIEDRAEREALKRFEFTCVTASGYQFTVQGLGLDQPHAYRRLNGQTGKQLNIPAKIIH